MAKPLRYPAAALLVVPPLDTKKGLEFCLDDFSDWKNSKLTASKTPRTLLSLEFWFCSDISGSKMGKGRYKSFGNNGIFVVPFAGKKKGQVLQVASAPNDAEFSDHYIWKLLSMLQSFCKCS